MENYITTSPHNEQETIATAVEAGSFSELPAVGLSIITSLVLIVIYGIPVVSGDSTFNILTLHPGYWVLIAAASLASVVWCIRCLRRITKDGREGTGFATIGLVLGLANLLFSAIPLGLLLLLAAPLILASFPRF